MRVHLAIDGIIMDHCQHNLSCWFTLVDSEKRCEHERTVAVRNELVPWRGPESVHRLQVRVSFLLFGRGNEPG
jgi:hypothetical protein